jgi:hypothetical protein
MNHRALRRQVVGFQHRSDAERFLNFALSLHPEKTLTAAERSLVWASRKRSISWG